MALFSGEARVAYERLGPFSLLSVCEDGNDNDGHALTDFPDDPGSARERGSGLSALIAQRISPADPRVARKVSVGAEELQTPLDRERGEVGVHRVVSSRRSSGQEPREDRPVALRRDRNPDVGAVKPRLDGCPGVGEGEGMLERPRVGRDSNERQGRGPRHGYEWLGRERFGPPFAGAIVLVELPMMCPEDEVGVDEGGGFGALSHR